MKRVEIVSNKPSIVIGPFVAALFLVVVFAIGAFAASGGNEEIVPVNDDTKYCREACGVGKGITNADYFGYDTANQCLKDCFVAKKISSAARTCNPYLMDNCCNRFAMDTDPDCVTEPQICTDSDGGKNFAVKGTAYGRHQVGEGPEIKNWTDYCINSDTLYEYSCRTLTYPDSDPLDVWVDLIICPNGCFDGACL